VNSARGGMRRGKRGDTRYVVANRRAADRFFVVERFATEGRVDHQIDLTCFYQVNDVRPPFVYFEHRLRPRSRRLPAPPLFLAWPASENPVTTAPFQGPPRCFLSRSFTLRKTVPCRGKRCPAASWAFANASPYEVEIPMTSPVERISGPRIVSTPRNLLNGNTGDFTE